MKLSHYSIFFAIILTTVLTVMILHTYLLNKQVNESIEMERAVSSATEASLMSAYTDEDEIFSEAKSRETAIDSFYQQLNKSLGFAGSRENLSFLYVPFVVLVDNDGYYVSYQTVDKDSDGNSFDDIVISNKYTFTSNYSGYHVRFFQNNTVNVSDLNGKSYTGTYDEIYNELGQPLVLHFMSSLDSFLNEKRTVIVGLIEDELTYLIKTHNTGMNDNGWEYSLSLPATDGDNQARLLDAPSVIAFYQGEQKNTTEGYINVYAFAGSIIDDASMYFEEYDTNGDLYYHKKGCSYLGTTDNNEGKTMQDCAEDGAIPCPDCIK